MNNKQKQMNSSNLNYILSHLLSSYNDCEKCTHIIQPTINAKCTISHNTNSFECRVRSRCLTKNDYLNSCDTSFDIYNSSTHSSLEKQQLSRNLREQRWKHFEEHGTFFENKQTR